MEYQPANISTSPIMKFNNNGKIIIREHEETMRKLLDYEILAPHGLNQDLN